ILRITPLANKSIEDVKKAVNELCEFVESLGGDIARLGEERVVVCPPNVKIWREKTPVTSEPISTAA
ncbi:MAG: cell division protein SepF, partial [Candidatus Bathyarchaeia archaeon]